MGLEQNMLNESVSRLNLRNAITVNASLSIQEACNLMREQGIGCVVVVDGDGKPIGKFTERILIELLAKDPDAISQSVGEYMNEIAGQVRATDPILCVLDAMQEHNLRFVVVVDEHEKVIGLTGQRGMAEYVADHFPHHSMTSRAGQSPAINRREGA